VAELANHWAWNLLSVFVQLKELDRFVSAPFLNQVSGNANFYFTFSCLTKPYPF
jgi:hypothetical protein